MYESFFNLKKKPFELVPNPEFLFMSKSHRRALMYLDYGIRERAGFILLTGEVGSGKTTLIRNLIKKHLDNVILSKIFNTRVDSNQLIAMINDDFGLPTENKDKITLLRELNDFLINQFVKGNSPVIIIDEAQNLGADLLEEVRMLSNLETDKAKLLQIILVGQPELRGTLASPALVQLRQRISINCHIYPMSSEETEQYILHRLEKAGDRRAVTFADDSMSIIYKYSKGIPRLINIISDFLLLAAFAEETTVIGADMVRDIIGDLDFERHFWGSSASGSGGNGAGSPSPAHDFTRLIKEITSRLETLGKESEMTKQAIVQEVSSKIEAMEQTLKMHREETGSMIASLQKNLPAGGVPPIFSEEKTAPLKRMLGR